MADINDLSTDVSIHAEGSNTAVTTTTDGSKERLDVSLGDQLSFSLAAFTPKTTSDPTGITLSTGSWSTLLNVTSTSGKLNFIASAGSTSNYRVRVTVDGNEVFDESMSDLAAIGLGNATNVEIWAETANKNFRYHPKTPVDFTDSLLIEAQSTSASPNLTYYIAYREQQ